MSEGAFCSACCQDVRRLLPIPISSDGDYKKLGHAARLMRRQQEEMRHCKQPSVPVKYWSGKVAPGSIQQCRESKEIHSTPRWLAIEATQSDCTCLSHRNAALQSSDTVGWLQIRQRHSLHQLGECLAGYAWRGK